MNSPCHSLSALLLCGLLSLILNAPAHAGSATWLANPSSNKWNTATNWMPATVPNDPADTATFGFSNTKSISISANTTVDGIVFDIGASRYTIAPKLSPSTTLTLSGAGITNNSGVTQNFVTGVTFNGISHEVGSIVFSNAASAGRQTVFTVNGSNANSTEVGAIVFNDSSSAGEATFLNLPNPSNLRPGRIDFNDEATAGNAVITNVGSAVTNGTGAQVYFYGNSSAGQATFVCGGAEATGGYTESFVEFRDRSTAGSATLTANGGTLSVAPGGVIYFQSLSHQNPSTGSATLIANGGSNGGQGGKVLLGGKVLGAARVIVSDDGNLDVSTNAGLGDPVSIGSLEGNGRVFLGRTTLEILGKRNTDFSGQISDLGGYYSFTNGKLLKSGRGQLVLSGASDYTGGTTITGGELFVNNTFGSATGSGDVRITKGTFGGTGTISGDLILETTIATLEPGESRGVVGTLTTLHALSFAGDAAFNCDLDADTVRADEVVADGVMLGSAALLTLVPAGSSSLPLGTVFTLISNTSANPISGTFANLPDGGIVTVNGSNLQASYSGGDGNDLTLTVVP